MIFEGVSLLLSLLAFLSLSVLGYCSFIMFRSNQASNSTNRNLISFLKRNLTGLNWKCILSGKTWRRTPTDTRRMFSDQKQKWLNIWNTPSPCEVSKIGMCFQTATGSSILYRELLNCYCMLSVQLCEHKPSAVSNICGKYLAEDSGGRSILQKRTCFASSKWDIDWADMLFWTHFGSA